MPQSLTTSEFLERAKANHGYDYTKTTYINKTTTIKFNCEKHGEVEQLPMNHLKIGCPYCSRGTHNEHSFLNACKSKFDYDYTSTKYINSKKKIQYDCGEHGLIAQYPMDHLETGCPQCAGKRKTVRLTAETILSRFRKSHGNKYIYPDLTDVKSHDIIEVICKKHNHKFRIKVYAHMGCRNSSPQGCRLCGYENRKNAYQKTTDEFIAEAQEKWADRYDYSKTEYVNKYTKILFCCYKHEDVVQYPNLHIRNGCPFCNGRGIGKYTPEFFLKRAKEVHGDKYDYSKVRFDTVTDHITISCKKHGEFLQPVYRHICGHNGCPRCAIEQQDSRLEREVLSFIKSVYSDKIERHNRELLDGSEIDIWLPSINLGIEVHGIYWHTEQFVGRNHHKKKADIAKDKNIRLIQIYETEWRNKKDIVQSIVNNLLGNNIRVYGRQTKIIELDKKSKNEFNQFNHLQGRDNSSIAYGLEHNGELVSCMTFGKPRFSKKHAYELIRFSSKLGYNVMGGAGKLLSHFRKHHDGAIITFADRRYSNGGLYYKLGFAFDGITKPGYHYYDANKKTLANRVAFQKHKLESKLDVFDANLSEYQNMKLNGYDRIWDAGQYRFVLC